MESETEPGVAGAPRMTPERLKSFVDAWGRKDIETLMSFITDDCVFCASVGPEPGATYVGRADVRKGFEKLLQHDAMAEPRGGRVFIAGDRGAAEWAFIYTDDSGREIEVRGCDLFEFVGDKIKRKDAFRKTY